LAGDGRGKSLKAGRKGMVIRTKRGVEAETSRKGTSLSRRISMDVEQMGGTLHFPCGRDRKVK